MRRDLGVAELSLSRYGGASSRSLPQVLTSKGSEQPTFAASPLRRGNLRLAW
jgi:hypothetical protein